MLNRNSTQIAPKYSYCSPLHCSSSSQAESNIDLFSDLIHVRVCNTKILSTTVDTFVAYRFPIKTRILWFESCNKAVTDFAMQPLSVFLNPQKSILHFL